EDRGDPRADHHDHDLFAAGVRRADHHAVHAEARRAEEHAVPRPPGHAHLRHAPERGRDGLLRQAQVREPRVRVARLRVQGVPRGRHGEARHIDQWRARRRALAHGAPGELAVPRPRSGRADARADPEADVRRRGAGGDRIAHHRARDGEGPAQERSGEVLRGRRDPEEKIAREAESGEEAHEAGRHGRDPAGGVPGDPAGGAQMNFALVLFVLTLFTGAFALADGVYFRRQRAPGQKEPWWIEYPKSFFPVILIVFLLRSFLVEPFKIPSGSMVPTLLVGDFILVNKFAYGIRLPIVNRKIVRIGEPKRGEVMVFRYPEDPSLDYIKRVVGLPGDRITYANKRLTINGVELPRR